MYKKVYEKEINGFYYLKGYLFEEKFSILDLIEWVKNSNFEINDIYIYEIGDIGTKTFQGTYSLEEFYNQYEKIYKDEIEGFRLDLSNRCEIYMKSDDYLTLSSQDNIELEAIIPNVKSKRL